MRRCLRCRAAFALTGKVEMIMRHPKHGTDGRLFVCPPCSKVLAAEGRADFVLRVGGIDLP